MTNEINPRDIVGPLAPVPTAVEGERIRIVHRMDRIKAQLHALELALAESHAGIPPGPECGQALTQEATSISVAFGRLDAYIRAEQAAKP